MTAAKSSAAMAKPKIGKAANLIVAANTGRLAKPHELVLMSSAQNASVMECWNTFGELDVSALANDLYARSQVVKKGDLGTVESMLFGQAMSLQAIFANLSRQSANNLGSSVDVVDKYLRLALKAQSQCRATLETLAIVKNPQPYIRQANIANGPQQNNFEAESARSQKRAREKNQEPFPSNELLGAPEHGQRLDGGAQGPSGATHSKLEPVGAVHRPAQPTGKAKKRPERTGARHVVEGVA